MKSSLLLIIIILVASSIILLVISNNVANSIKLNPINTQLYNNYSITNENNFFIKTINMSLHSLVYDNSNSTTTNLANSTVNPDGITINFHNVTFTFHHICCVPMPLDAPIPVSLKFSDGINETLTVIDPQTTNQTIVILSKHTNPQAGISSAKNILNLVVSKG